MKFKIFLGKLGNESFLADCETTDATVLPHKGELINISTGDGECDCETYKVINVANDYHFNEYNVFVKPYDWDF